MRGNVHLPVALIGVLVGAIACTPTPSSPAPPPAKSPARAPTIQISKETDPQAVLRFGLAAADLGTADPHFAAGTQDRIVADLVFNGLLRYQPGNAPLIEPDLAESIPQPQIINDKQVWTFKLKRGIKCHPGPKTAAYELTADDVVYSLRKSANTRQSAYAGEYSGMTLDKEDNYTIRISLDSPLSSVLFLPKVTDYAGGFIVCQKAVEAMGSEAFSQHPVGTGPFIFKEYTPGKQIQLSANEEYFRGSPLLRGILLRFMPDVAQRERALKNGDVDLIQGINESAWLEKMEREAGIITDLHGVGEVATVHFNTTASPLDDVRVRRAIALAIDRDKILRIFGKRIAEKVYSPVPAQFLPGGLTRKEAEALSLDYDIDIEKSRQLLAAAGYPEGFTLDLTSSEIFDYRIIYKNLQKQLAQVGITVNINIVDHATMHKKIRQDLNPLVIYVAWRPNADVYLTRFFHSDSIVVRGTKPDTNFSHYREADNLIEAARRETSPGTQTTIWKHAQIKILEDMAAYPLVYFNQVYARRATVDYGHEPRSILALYPQITEKTRMTQ